MNLALVEIHDVSPYYYKETLQAIKLMSLCGIKKYSLLVVPNFWGKAHLYEHPEFVHTILSTKQEVVLHGCYHEGGSIKDIIWTSGEGEFSNLNLMQTYQRIKEGKDIFEAVGIKSDIFVPPAWIGNPYLEDVLYSLDFKMVACRDYIKDLESELVYTSPVITFSNRPILSWLSIGFAPLLFRAFKRNRLIRLALHAKDFRDRRKVKLWRVLLSKIKEHRRLISYGELIRQSRPALALQSV
ncbi:DUF2334 domain-containing protein [Hydrogenobacter hydrogenophilus]|uniref:DUF2334 domain-containing protein n=1 Tax=Hydrogenobacter hydrogenophilus TaxID=35835 RepID=A0A285NYA9_9AQUI|nr:polysaccharide deacetylase family protein [Hydrogenobacter hydrogenophilus]SNZ14429.1 hypothetical protein SAMN06265353_1090 [Hydrogenobacter hydrogenophilus]